MSACAGIPKSSCASDHSDPKRSDGSSAVAWVRADGLMLDLDGDRTPHRLTTNLDSLPHSPRSY
jgi:hypothetical protein